MERYSEPLPKKLIRANEKEIKIPRPRFHHLHQALHHLGIHHHNQEFLNLHWVLLLFLDFPRLLHLIHYQKVHLLLHFLHPKPISKQFDNRTDIVFFINHFRCPRFRRSLRRLNHSFNSSFLVMTMFQVMSEWIETRKDQKITNSHIHKPLLI